MSFWTLSAPEATPALLVGSHAVNSGTVTYGELARHADEFIELLGIPAQKRLGVIVCRNATAAIYGYIGALRSGDAIILLNEETNSGLLQALLDAYDPDWILRPARDQLPEGYSSHAYEDSWQLLRREANEQGGPVHPDIAVLLSTSGTTGSPKMVKLSYRNIAANAKDIADYLSIGPEDRAVTTLPFNYSYGMSVINSHLTAGASLVLTASSLLTREFWDTITYHHVTSLAGVPYTYQMLHRLDPRRLTLDSLRTLTQAGGRLSPRLVDYFCELSAERGWQFFVMYGQTEASPRISYVPPAMLAAKSGAIGIAVPSGRLSLSEQGELIFQGPNVMMGYAECRDDLASGDELGGLLATGDLASMDADGYFYLHGRLRRFVKIHGNRVSLDDIEQKLEAEFHLPVAVVGKDDKLAIYLTEDIDPSAAKDVLTSTYNLHPTTFSIVQIETIPHTPSGKKDYAGLA